MYWYEIRTWKLLVNTIAVVEILEKIIPKYFGYLDEHPIAFKKVEHFQNSLFRSHKLISRTCKSVLT